jgi:hypothetical protein
MGGRGAASGISKQGKKYGTEYKTLLAIGNIKFIEENSGDNHAPVETMTKGRVYVSVNSKDHHLKSINYYDDDGKRFKSVHLDHPHRQMLPHTHEGYYHDEYRPKGPRKTNDRERALIEKVNRIWEQRQRP